MIFCARSLTTRVTLAGRSCAARERKCANEEVEGGGDGREEARCVFFFFFLV